MKVAETEVREIPLKQLVLDKSVNMRPFIDKQTAAEYSQVFRDNPEAMPPIIVFYQVGSRHYVADGWHRVEGARLAGLKTIRAEVRHGDKRAAILYAAGANAFHGVRRSRWYVKQAITTLLKDKVWHQWADTEIAKTCNVSVSTVAKYRELLGAESATRVYLDAKGEMRVKTYQTGGERAAARAERLAEKPPIDCPNCGQPVRCQSCGHTVKV